MSMQSLPKRRAVHTQRAAACLLCMLLLSSCGAEQEPLPSAIGSEVAVEVRSVVLDPSTDSPIVLLEERQGERTLPIWIGAAEARSIAVELGNIAWPRPNSHDLAERLLTGLGGRVERVVVTELRGSTYFALLVIRTAGQRVEIDARPSDAIAIALRVDAPVYVRDTLLKGAIGQAGRDDAVEPELAL